MKKIFFLFLIVISSNAFTIYKNETFEIKTPAKIMTTNFSLQMKNRNNDIIIKTFNKIIKEVRKSKICEGGKFSINPNYEWINDKRVFKGYQGYITFTCIFKNTKKYAKLIEQVKNKKGVIFNQDRINFVAPNNKNKLEDKAYHYAINYTKYLTKTFNTKCKIKEIHLNNSYYNPPFYKTMSKSLSIEKPIQKSVTSKLNVNYIFECN
jgi:hypothetical protein